LFSLHRKPNKEAEQVMAHQPAWAPQFHFNIHPTAPVGAHQTFGYKMKTLVTSAVYGIILFAGCQGLSSTIEQRSLLEVYNEPIHPITLPVALPALKPWIERPDPRGFRPFSNWSIPVPGGAFGLQGDSAQTCLVFGRHFKILPMPIERVAVGILLGFAIVCCGGAFVSSRRKNA
jgi:hypothetical protein